MNQGKKAMELLLVLVSEHYKLEENYGRELKKILKKVEELQEIGYVSTKLILSLVEIIRKFPI